MNAAPLPATYGSELSTETRRPLVSVSAEAQIQLEAWGMSEVLADQLRDLASGYNYANGVSKAERISQMGGL